MTIFRLIATGFLVGGLAGACGGTTSGAGSNSNWLAPCGATADCKSGLECRCGMCTAACETATDCAELASGATCAPTTALGASCAGATTKSCAPGCTKDGDCTALGDGARCASSVCAAGAPPSDGGTTPGDGSTFACDAVPNRANGLVTPIVDAADRSCKLDSDCESSPSVTCRGSCGIPFISKSGATAIAPALAKIEKEVCGPFHAAGCTAPVLFCPAIGDPRCVSGLCASSLDGAVDAGHPSCSTQTAAMADRLQAAQAAADRACSVDGDCTTVPLDDRCYHACQSSVVSRAGAKTIEAELSAMEAELCPAFDAAGCTALVPPCVAPPTSVCVGGACIASVP